MINSKPLKSLPKRVKLRNKDKSDTRIGKILDAISYGFKMYLYYPVEGFVNRIHERSSRSLAFAKHGWMHYDFDSAFLYEIMAFKLKRIYKCLENGHAIHRPEDLKALKETIKICERLFAGDYDAKYYKAHEKKWGSLKSKNIPEYNEKGEIKHYRWESSRKNAKTAAQQKREVADLRQIWENEEKDRRADLDRLNELLKNHQPTWWD